MAVKRGSMGMLLWLLAACCFPGCVSDCPHRCPSKCVPFSFALLQGGVNILEKDPAPFPVDSFEVEVISGNPEASHLFSAGKKGFTMILCEDTKYMLHVSDSISISIEAEIETSQTDECCVYFSASSIKLNGHEFAGGSYELNP